jgi:fucose 4-O-acetylase-like acetyltransferase
MKKHEEWIDNLKGLGIILIVFHHSFFPSDNIIKHYFISFMVPLFFFISGFLYSQKPNFTIWDYLKTRLKRLIIPYLCFNLLAYLFLGLEGLITKNAHFFTISGLKNFLKYLFYGIYTHVPGNHVMNIPTWFLPCLLFTGLYFYLIDNYLKSRNLKLLIIVILSVLIFFESQHTNFRMPFSMDIAFMALLFYGIGNLFKNEIINLVQHVTNYYLLLIPILVAINVYFVNDTEMSTNGYDNYFKLIICSIAGITVFTIISKVIGKSFLGYYGANSIIVLCMQWINRMCYSLIVFLSFNLLSKNPGYISGIVQTIVCMIFLIPIIYIINHYFPILIGNFKQKAKLFPSEKPS